MKRQQEDIRVFDFAEYPGPRYKIQGEDSGEKFYEDFFKPAFENGIDKNMKVVINLDYTAGYAPSFIDEIFGNLVYDFDFLKIKEILEIISEDEPHWIKLVYDDIFPKWIKKKNAGKPRRPEL